MRKAGFLLIELLISLLVLSLISLIVFQYHSSIILKQRDSLEYLKAIYLLNNCADEIIAGASLKKNINYEKYLITITQIYPQNVNSAHDSIEYTKSFKLFNIAIDWLDYKKNNRKLEIISGGI